MAKNFNIVALFSILIVFFLLAFTSPFLDSDFGWHLKTGEFIVREKHIPHSDIFSYSFPDYKWVDYEYLFQILIFFIFSALGIYGVSIIFALLNIFLFLFLVPKINSSQLFPVFKTLFGLGVFFILSPLISVRPVIFTWFGFVLTLIILHKSRKDVKKEYLLWFLPFIFLVWANLHPGFPIGIFLMLIFMVIEGRKNSSFAYLKTEILVKRNEVMSKSCIKKLKIIFVLSLFSTFINPYFYNLHLYIFNVLTDTFAKTYIFEWQPLNISHIFGVSYILFALFFFLLVIFTGLKKGEITDFMIALFFFIFGFLSFRNGAFFVFSALPEIYRRLEGLKLANDFSVFLNKKATISAVLILIISSPLLFMKLHLLSFTEQEKEKYPTEAIEYLKNNSSYNNIFNFYNWGGYLVWNIPKKKIFIDGKMPEWKTKNKRILKDYDKIANLKEGWDDKINEYNIDLVFLPINTPLISALKIIDDWKEVFKDQKSVIMFRAKHY